jgi:ABC-type uncharacterized transport system substrate-binding protein
LIASDSVARLFRAALVAAALAVAVAPFTASHAHPHVFIEYSVTVVVGAGGVEAVQFTWTFDEFTSSMIMQEFDKDRDGILPPRRSGASSAGISPRRGSRSTSWSFD